VSGGAVAVVEPAATGHRASYVRWVADAARALGRSVVLVTRDPDAWTGAPVDEIVGPVGGPPPGSVAERRAMLDAAARRGVEALVFTTADPFSQVLLRHRTGGRPAVGIFHMAPWRTRRLSGEVRRLTHLSAPWAARLHVASRLTRDRRWFAPIEHPVRIGAPLDQAACRAAWHIGADEVLVACSGALVPRKGVPAVTAALAEGTLGRTKVVLAGRLEPSVRAALPVGVVTHPAVTIVDRHLEEDELRTLAVAADWYLALQDGHEAISATAIEAMCEGAPILVWPSTVMSDHLAHEGMGQELPRDRPSLAAALLALEPNRRETVPAWALAVRDVHDPDRFIAKVAAALRTHLSG
jgi:hypothetical protein